MNTTIIQNGKIHYKESSNCEKMDLKDFRKMKIMFRKIHGNYLLKNRVFTVVDDDVVA